MGSLPQARARATEEVEELVVTLAERCERWLAASCDDAGMRVVHAGYPPEHQAEEAGEGHGDSGGAVRDVRDSK